MSKAVEFLKNEHIQIALATGSAILLLSLFFKKYLNMPEPPLESALPGFAFIAYQVYHAKRKGTPSVWNRPWPWIVIMYLVVALIMARRLWFAAA